MQELYPSTKFLYIPEFDGAALPSPPAPLPRERGATASNPQSTVLFPFPQVWGKGLGDGGQTPAELTFIGFALARKPEATIHFLALNITQYRHPILSSHCAV